MEEPSLAGARHTPGVQIAEVVEVPTVEAEVPTVDPIEVKSPAKLQKRHLKANRTAKLGTRTSVTKRKVAAAKKHENQKQAKTKLAGAGTVTAWDAYPGAPAPSFDGDALSGSPKVGTGNYRNRQLGRATYSCAERATRY